MLFIANAKVVSGAFEVSFTLGLLVLSVYGSLIIIVSLSCCEESGSVFSLVFFYNFSARASGYVHPLSLSWSAASQGQDKCSSMEFSAENM